MKSAYCLLAATAVMLSACGAGVYEPGEGPLDRPTAYETACLAAVANRTGVSGVSLNRSSLSEATDSATVLVNVPGAAAPWVCESSASGAIRQVSYSGVEGAL